MVFDGSTMVVLDEAECLRLLASQHIGRVAVTVGAVPAVFPVSFGLVDGAVVFCTGAGSKLSAATRDSVVAFEVDEVDPARRQGWSVLLVGVAEELHDPELVRRVMDLPWAAWAPGRRVVRLVPEYVSGRRIAGDPVVAEAAAS